MAFASGKESTAGLSVKRYIGIAPVSVLAVNPTKAELEGFYNTTLENAPVYLGETELDNNGTKYKVPQVRISFVVRTDVEKTGIDTITTINFFLNKEVRYNKDRTKVQVINKYGETTWLSIEDAKNKTIPEGLSWFEPAEFRPAFIGEEELTAFIKAYLNIPNKSYRTKDGRVVEIANKADAEARLDSIQDYFKGDFKEIKTVIALQPNNKVKVLFGVRTTDDNKQYQAVYTQKFLKNSITDYSYLEKDLQDRKAAGAYPTTEFAICDLKEYSLEATKYEETAEAAPAVENPWGFN